MGGGDLNFKKSWHPLRMHNQEKVWKEERKAAEEQKRLDQLRKEIEEQRQLEEMQQLQEKAGLKKKSTQLEWMYACTGGSQGSGAPPEDKEAYLMGTKKVDKILNSADGEEIFQVPGKVGALDLNAPATLRDTQMKIREDPLLMIKKMEQASLDRYLNNPIKLNHLKEAKKKAKKEKKSKKDKYDDIEEERHSRSHRRYDGDDRQHSSSYRQREEETRDRHRKNSPSPRRSRRDRSRSPQRFQRDPARSPLRRDTFRRREEPYNRAPQVDPKEEELRKRQEREEKLRAMQSDAEHLHSERRQRLEELVRQDAEEEARQRQHQKMAYQKGHTARFMSDAHQSAYSSKSNVDLGARIRSQRAKLQLDE